MKILFVRNNTFEYIAKIYWSLQKGLSKKTDLTAYGQKQDFYHEDIQSYPDIVDLCYGNGCPDIVITDFDYKNMRFRHEGIEKLPRSVKRVMILGDYWAIPNKQKFVDIVNEHFDYVLTLFYDVVVRYPEIRDKLIFCPPSVDINMFHDWREEKEFEVGFLGAGCASKGHYYPERFRITKLLQEAYGDKFFTTKHPGWGYFKKGHGLVGEGFSKAINKCKVFFTTSGKIGHCNPKYCEVMASGSLLFGSTCNHLEKYHFQDGVNCVIFKDDNDMMTRLKAYLKDDRMRERVTRQGLVTIAKHHTGEKRAEELLEVWR